MNIQTLYDALTAFGVVVGIAGTLALAIAAAGTLFRRRELHTVLTVSPQPQPSPADDRVLVRR